MVCGCRGKGVKMENLTPANIVKNSCQVIRYSKCSKISNTFLFLFSNKMVIRAGIHKMVARIANREDPDQTASQTSEAV